MNGSKVMRESLLQNTAAKYTQLSNFMDTLIC